MFRGRSLLLVLWWNCIYSLRIICCISNCCEFKFGKNLRVVVSIFIENIFRSHLVVFLSTLEGFLRKIWCFCGCVSIGACWNFCFHIYCYCLEIIYFWFTVDIKGFRIFPEQIYYYNNLISIIIQPITMTNMKQSLIPTNISLQ